MVVISDEELTAEALAADGDEVVPEDAVPWSDVVDDDAIALLPSWYMPAPLPGTRMLDGWRRRLAMIVIVAFVAINAAGLCSTYGLVELAAGH